ncbi:MAG: hypothetical protein AB2A00_11640 [Myxococcota bacterium]
MVFDYDFLSQEFDGYVGSVFDDTFSVTVAGAGGSYTETVTTVNLVGVAASVPVNVPWDTAFQHTGWRTHRVDLRGLEGDLTITFSITDVGDSAFGSVALLDNIRFE